MDIVQLVVFVGFLAILERFPYAAAAAVQKCKADVKSMENLDINQLGGLWFGDTTNDNLPTLSCATIVYPNNVNSSRFFIIKKFMVIDGASAPLDMSTAAAYDVEHRTLLEHYVAPSAEVLLSTKVLATDYKTYAIIHSCGISANLEREGITILSRNPTGLPMHVRRQLHELIAVNFEGARQYNIRREGCPKLFGMDMSDISSML